MIARRSRKFVDVVMGRAFADLVITNGQWVCVQSGDIIPNTDIAIVDSRIAYVGENADHNVQLSLLALVVIPELRISDLGLVDVTKFEFVPVVESNG